MNFTAKPVGDKLIVRLEGDLTYDVAKDLETELLNIISKEKKSIIFDFGLVKYLSLDACISFVKIYKVALDQKVSLIAIKVNDVLSSVLLNLGFDSIFTFAADISSAMNIKVNLNQPKQEKKETQDISTANNVDAVSGGQSESGNNPVLERSKKDTCEYCVKKFFLFGKKCGNCRFFENYGNGKGRCKR